MVSTGSCGRKKVKTTSEGTRLSCREITHHDVIYRRDSVTNLSATIILGLDEVRQVGSLYHFFFNT